MNVLIPNIGRRGYLVKYIKEIENFRGKVYVSDCDTTASGLYGNNDGYFILPKPVDNEKKYVDSLLNLCRKNDIGIIIPVIDPEIYILSKYVNLFKEEDILLMVSNEKVLDICYNKLHMNDFLKKNNFLVPKTYENINDFMVAKENYEIDFPVIIKPIYGSGSASTYIVNCIEKMKALFQNGMLIQELIDGQEYGIDVFNDMHNKPVRCVVKKKISMRSGETDKAISVKNKDIQNNAIRLAECLKHFGNLDCDMIMRDNNIYIIDLNPRFGGGYPATHATGTNLLKMTLDIAYGNEIAQQFDDYKESVLVMKEVSIVSREVSIDEKSGDYSCS